MSLQLKHWAGPMFSGVRGFHCSRILQHHFPETHHHNDIHDFNAKPYRGNIDIITGDFANLSEPQASAKGLPTIAISGKKCFGLFEKLAPPMSCGECSWPR